MGNDFLAKKSHQALTGIAQKWKGMMSAPTKQIEHNFRLPGYTGDRLQQIAFPLGGIGAGCICLNGYGGLQDFSIRHRPALSASLAFQKETAFAVLSLKDTRITRIVEAPFPIAQLYDRGLRNVGLIGNGWNEGLPRFLASTFRGEYPFALVDLADPEVPLKVSLCAFNPFIPLDDVNSGIPCAILEYQLHNPTDRTVSYEFSYHVLHLAPGSDLVEWTTSRNAPIPGVGVLFNNTEPATEPEYGSVAFGLIGYNAKIKAMWFRGRFFDAMSVLWQELTTGAFTTNEGAAIAEQRGPNGGSLLIEDALQPGETKSYPIVLTWYFPNVDYTYGGTEDAPGADSDDKPSRTKWHPFYAAVWTDAADVLGYVKEHYPDLRRRTASFHDALFGSTLPDSILDAVSANLAILKSPTVLRQKNGNIWGWEGCNADKGCCHGSCTHVWNYAQSMPHLFPKLERTLREQEYYRSMDETGHVNFRAALPDGPTPHTFHPACDGQLGGVMKVFREWQISGDRKWLEEIYPYVKRSIDFCIARWDPRHKGVVEEPHHNTYDIEFWGPDGMCTAFYIGGLTAMGRLARDVGRSEEAALYDDLVQKSVAFMDSTLFNGEYYEQEVTYQGLVDTSLVEKLKNVDANSSAEDKLLLAEGPKYQYGSGCISDGVFGICLALLCSLHTPLNREHVRRHLQAIFKYNFRQSLEGHSNAQRPGYALGNESGLLLCSWPHGGKPSLPFPYSDEVWTGIEYQVASHLIAEGMLAEGLAIVQGARQRFDGQKRNPWNEYECGSYYARAMSSYGLLISCAGFSYSAVTKTLELKPKIIGRRFSAFFSTASGWGTIALDGNTFELEVIEGFVDLNEIHLEWGGQDRILKPTVYVEPQTPLKISTTGI